jgi:hypothetical protein
MGNRAEGQRGTVPPRETKYIYIHEGVINLRDVGHHGIINAKVAVVVGIKANNKGIGGKYSG